VPEQKPKTIALIGAPTDVGAGRRGASMGPEAMRVAGLSQSLLGLGYTVHDRGNVSGPPNPEDSRRDGYRHLPEVAAWCAAVRRAVDAALSAGELPVVLGGDHSLAIGSIAALSSYCIRNKRTLVVLWLDAHADFNTAATSPTGNLHGMPAAVICGSGPSELLDIADHRPMVPPERIIQVGTRSIDGQEKALLLESGVYVWDMRTIDELRMSTVMQRILDAIAQDDCHLHLSFDVDFLDPSIAPGVPTQVAGGPTYREAQLCMEMIYDSGLLGSVEIMELNPAHDHGNRTAELTVELMESLFGAQILARPRGQRGKYGL